MADFEHNQKSLYIWKFRSKAQKKPTAQDGRFLLCEQSCQNVVFAEVKARVKYKEQ